MARVSTPLVRQRSSRVPRSLALLLVLVSLCLFTASISAVAAAVGVAGGSGAAMPTWRVGDVVPLTIYVRLARQVRADTWTFGHRGDVEDDVVEPHEHDGFGNAKEAAEAKKQELQGAIDDLEVATDGFVDLAHEPSGGKHRYQYMRAVPPRLGPRFAISSAPTLRLRGWYEEAAKQMRNSTSGAAAPLQSELALRVSLGRGLKKETTWLPIAVRRDKLWQMDPMMLVHPMNGADAPRAKGTQPAELVFLREIFFDFGYQTGATNTITSYAVRAAYMHDSGYEAYISRNDHGEAPYRFNEGLRLAYSWSEHRPYNTTRAITLCSGAALMGALVMVLVTFNSRSKTSKQFRRHGVTLKMNEG